MNEANKTRSAKLRDEFGIRHQKFAFLLTIPYK